MYISYSPFKVDQIVFIKDLMPVKTPSINTKTNQEPVQQKFCYAIILGLKRVLYLIGPLSRRLHALRKPGCYGGAFGAVVCVYYCMSHPALTAQSSTSVIPFSALLVYNAWCLSFCIISVTLVILVLLHCLVVYTVWLHCLVCDLPRVSGRKVSHK